MKLHSRISAKRTQAKMTKDAGKKKGGKEPLEAVVIADLFGPENEALGRPAALWPLANIPMVDYCMEFLSHTEVQRVCVVTAKESAKVKKHIIETWGGHFDPVTVLCAEAANSFGDCMREVDARGEVKGEFLLVQAGSLCSSNLAEAVQEHKARRVKDKSCVMTLICTSASRIHLLRDTGTDIFLVNDEASKQIVHFKQIFEPRDWHELDIPKGLIGKEGVRMRADLLDTGISVCSPQIPPLFSDNFDFDNRRDVIKEIFDNEEILGFKCHAHFLSGKEFAFTLTEYSQMLSVGNLVLERWTFPLVVDGLTGRGVDRFKTCDSFRYLSVQHPPCIDRSASVDTAVIGMSTEIGKNCEIKNCIIGPGCKIGDGVNLKNCVLWDEVTISAGAQCSYSIFCDKSTLAENSVAEARTTLGPNVMLSKTVALPPGTFVTVEQEGGDFFDDFSLKPSPHHGKGYVEWVREAGGTVWRPPKDRTPAVDASGAPRQEKAAGKSRQPRTTSTASSEAAPEPGASAAIGDVEDDDELKHKAFYKELIDCMSRSEEENFAVENLLAEINPLRMAYPSVSLEDLNQFLVRATLDLSVKGGLTGDALFAKFKKVVSRLSPLLTRYIREDSEEAQLDCMVAVEEFANKSPVLLEILHKVCYFLYDSEMVSEDAFLQWHSDLDLDEPEGVAINSKVAKFIQWLQEAEEDESD